MPKLPADRSGITNRHLPTHTSELRVDGRGLPARRLAAAPESVD